MTAQRLDFTSANYQKIVDGKLMTIRKGIKRLHLGMCILTENDVVKSSVLIEELQIVRYKDLDDLIAVRDGFVNAGELKAELKNLYQEDFEGRKPFTLVCFRA